METLKAILEELPPEAKARIKAKATVEQKPDYEVVAELADQDLKKRRETRNLAKHYSYVSEEDFSAQLLITWLKYRLSQDESSQ